MPHELTHGEFLFSDSPVLVDLNVVHGFLAHAYWCHSIPRDLLAKAISNSMPFGVYDQSVGVPQQVGFARIITDRATYAYIADVFILESYRGRGLSKMLMAHVQSHPDLQGLRRLCLLTRDAQGLYEKCGFGYLDDPKSFMQINNRDLYRTSQPSQ
jgi:GNAT superfamily N-acetyltransferase